MNRYRTAQLAIFAMLISITCLGAPAGAAQIQWNVRTVVSAGTPITGIGDAEDLLSGAIASSSTVTDKFNVINFNLLNDIAGGKFANDSAFPGISPSHDTDFAVEATGSVSIPSAGSYTFGVSSDDGFSLKVGSFSSEYPGQRKAAETYATFDFSKPGIYPVDLVFFQHMIAAELELFATSGSFTTFGQKGSNFQLVGDTVDGGVALANPGVEAAIPEPSALAITLLPFSLLLLKRRCVEG